MLAELELAAKVMLVEHPHLHKHTQAAAVAARLRRAQTALELRRAQAVMALHQPSAELP
jgi:hypothetical protein